MKLAGYPYLLFSLTSNITAAILASLSFYPHPDSTRFPHDPPPLYQATISAAAITKAQTPLAATTPVPIKGITTSPDKTPKPASTSQNSASLQLHQSLNHYRQTQGLSPIPLDPQLCQLANTRSKQIQTDFSHHQLPQLLNQINHTRFGENLWSGPFSAADIIHQWSQSPAHHANLTADWSRGCAAVFDHQAVYIFID